MDMLLKGIVLSSGDPAPSGKAAPATQRIANRPIVCHVIDALQAAGSTELAVIAPPRSLDEIQSSIEPEHQRCEVTYLPREGRRDLLAALATVTPFVGDSPCLVHLADGLAGQSLASVTAQISHDHPDLVLFGHRGRNRRPRAETAMQRLLSVMQLDRTGGPSGLAGLVYFGEGCLRHAAASSTAFDPLLDVVAIAERIAAGGGRLGLQHIGSWRRYKGDPLDLLELNRIVLDQMIPQTTAFEAGDRQIDGCVSIHPTAVVRASVIRGPAVIGARTRIEHAYIGPYTSIGDDVEIEGAEIERSIVCDGAKITHIPTRIEASTVGERARIFRDFAVPRALRLHVGEDVELALN
jgi:glucose-1-phosphate thymidylyltransferase